jgi:phasin family protein
MAKTNVKSARAAVAKIPAAKTSKPFEAFNFGPFAGQAFPEMGTEQFDQYFKVGFDMMKGKDMFKGYEDVVAFGKDNVEAMVKASTIWSKGLQTMGATVYSLTQASVEEGVTAAKALMSCKNVQDYTSLQADLAKTGYEKFVKEAGKVSEATVKLAEEAMEPIAARVNAAVELVGKFKAAA